MEAPPDEIACLAMVLTDENRDRDSIGVVVTNPNPAAAANTAAARRCPDAGAA